MLNKKNIAIAMAAATVATPVAQVFATQAEVKEDVIRTEGFAAFIAEVEEKLAVKYDETTKENKNVYTITFGKDNTLLTVENLETFKTTINNMKNGEILDVKIVDNGHEVRDGKIYDTAIPEYAIDVDDNKKPQGIITTLETAPTLQGYTVKSSKKVISDEDVKYTFSFEKDGKVEYTVTLGAGDKQLDFGNPIYNSGKLVGFKKAEIVEITDGETVVKTLSKSVEKTINADELFDGENLTEAGIELAKLEDLEGNEFEEITEDKERGIFTVKFVIKQMPMTKSVISEGTLSELFIESTSKAKLQVAVEKIKAYTEDEAVEFTTIAGENRFETAVEVSKARFENKGDADSVILVGENAIVDGLAAAPLATAKKAPILYTKSNTIPQATMDEIVRVFDNKVANKTVYLVGGETVISKDVEKQLANKGLNIVRLAGANRVETSLEIAEEIGTENTPFIVGYNGEVDAMSISAYAAQTNTPIVVAGQKGLTEETKEYIKDASNVTLVGGETVLSTNVEAQLNEMEISSERLAGLNRQETNAAVIEKFYTTEDKASFDNIYVAKSDVLVDALAAAPLAAEKQDPIVLATKALNEKQEKELKKANIKVEEKTLFQVGKGIAQSVIEKIAGLYVEQK